ncbi:hypothetical protein HDU80_001163 [Chytriomyces hyalinus]|nr:hypothetical protein HDU80_001163 [Chytriomyces hyalinus]
METFKFTHGGDALERDTSDTLALLLLAAAIVASTGILVNDGLVNTFTVSQGPVPRRASQSQRRPPRRRLTALRQMLTLRRRDQVPSNSITSNASAASPTSMASSPTTHHPSKSTQREADDISDSDEMLREMLGLGPSSSSLPVSGLSSSHMDAHVYNDDEFDHLSDGEVAHLVHQTSANDDVLSLVGMLMDGSNVAHEDDQERIVDDIQELTDLEDVNDGPLGGDEDSSSLEELSSEDDEDDERFFERAQIHPTSIRSFKAESSLSMDSASSSIPPLDGREMHRPESGRSRMMSEAPLHLSALATSESSQVDLADETSPNLTSQESKILKEHPSSDSKEAISSGYTLRRRRIFPSLSRISSTFSESGNALYPSNLKSPSVATITPVPSATPSDNNLNSPMYPANQNWRTSTTRRLRQIPRKIRRNVGAVSRNSSLVAFGAVMLLAMLWLVRMRGWSLLPRFWQLVSRRNANGGPSHLAYTDAFCWFQEFAVERSILTNFTISREVTLGTFDSVKLYSYWSAVAAVIAVNDFNKQVDVLSGAYVSLKFVTDCGAWFPNAMELFQGKPNGFASVVTANDISQIHQDIIGVIGDDYSSTARTLAAQFNQAQTTFKIPMCSATSASPRLSDRNKYGYFWRLQASTGLGEHFCLVLKEWNVRRVAMILQADDELGSQIALDIEGSLRRHGIDVVTHIELPSVLDNSLLDYASKELRRADARYFIISGQAAWQSQTYFSLANRNLSGPKYVWLSYANFVASQLVASEAASAQVAGLIYFSLKINDEKSEKLQKLYSSVLEISGLTVSEYPYQFFINTMAIGTYDCVMMMLLGFDKITSATKLLKSNKDFTLDMLASRQLQHLMDFKLFQTLDYAGMTLDKMNLNKFGNVEIGFDVVYFTGDGYNFVPFGETSANGTQFSLLDNVLPVFNGGSSIPPSDGPPPSIMFNANSYVYTLSGFAILFFSFTILLSACMSLGFIYQNRRKKSVLRTSFAILFLVAMGVILQGVALLFFIGAPTEFACHAKAWLQLLAFAIVLPAVTVKSYADYNLVLARKKLNPSTLFSTSITFMAVAFAAEAGLLLAWSLSGPHSVRTFKGDNYTMGYCRSLTDQNRVGIALHSFNGFLTLLSILFTFRAREAEPLNNESTFPSVVVSTYTLFQVTVLLLLEAENPSTKRLLTHAASIWIISMVTLTFVFAPKVVSIQADNRRVNSELAKILHPSSLRSGSEIGAGKLWRKTSEVKNLAVQRVSDVGRANSARIHRILASRKNDGPVEKAQLKHHILGKVCAKCTKNPRFYKMTSPWQTSIILLGICGGRAWLTVWSQKGVSVLQILEDSTKCTVAESLYCGHTVEISMLLDLKHPLATIPGYRLIMEFDGHDEAVAFSNAYHAFLQTEERSAISEVWQEDFEAGIAIRVSDVS